ncbi:MAG: metallophosphoesterase [Pseudomonadota bacterium]
MIERLFASFLLIFLIFPHLSCAQNHQRQSLDLKDKIYRVGVISDMNGSYGSKKYHPSVRKAVDYLADPANEIDFIISTGDMVAGQKSNLDYKGMWRAFHRNVTEPLIQAGVPVFPSPGNHDAYRTRKTERQHYRDFWESLNIPPQGSGLSFIQGVQQNYPFQYAFRVGPALFISIDNTDVRPWTEATLQWLEQVLLKEKATPIKVVYGHVPLIPFAFKKETEYFAKGSKGFLNDIQNLFTDYKVDFFLTGHSHVYYPGRRDAYTRYTSVPLLGGGPRYLIQQKLGERSQRGFLVLEFNRQGPLKVEHRLAENHQVIPDENFPLDLRLPSANTKLCKGCQKFPKTHFLDSQKRILYRRQDQAF